MLKELSTDMVMYEIFLSPGTVHRHAQRTVHRHGYVWNLSKFRNCHRHGFVNKNKKSKCWKLLTFIKIITLIISLSLYMITTRQNIFLMFSWEIKIYHLIIFNSWIEKNCLETWYIIVHWKKNIVTIISTKKYIIFIIFIFFHCWTKKLSTDMLTKKLSTDMFLQQKFSKSPKKHVLPLENIVNPAPLLRFINTCCTLIVLLARFHLARLTTI